MSINPYAPPQAPQGAIVAPGGEGFGVWREYDAIVIQRHGAMLPDRCVMCNEPANGYRHQRTFHWHNPALFIIALVSPLIYLIVALVVRKNATVALPICEQHRLRRRNGMLIGWLGMPAGLAVCVLAPIADVPILLGLGILGMIVAVIVGAVMARQVGVSKIDEHACWLKVGRPFLESLPTAALPAYGPPGQFGGYGR